MTTLLTVEMFAANYYQLFTDFTRKNWSEDEKELVQNAVEKMTGKTAEEFASDPEMMRASMALDQFVAVHGDPNAEVHGIPDVYTVWQREGQPKLWRLMDESVAAGYQVFLDTSRGEMVLVKNGEIVQGTLSYDGVLATDEVVVVNHEYYGTTRTKLYFA